MGASRTVQRLRRYDPVEVRAVFEPWHKGEETEDGEQRMFCPVCEDPATSNSPSASMNAEKGVWNCLTGDHEGSIYSLVQALGLRDRFDRPPAVETSKPEAVSQRPLPDQEAPHKYARALQSNKARLAWVSRERGITADSLARAEVGLRANDFVFPVQAAGQYVQTKSIRYRDGKKERPYQTNGAKTRLWPEQWLAERPDVPVLLCEGEWDAVLADQHSNSLYVAVTGTSGAKSAPRDLSLLRGREVFVAYDLDDAGRAGAKKIQAALEKAGARAYVLDLSQVGVPASQDKADVSDYFHKYNGSAAALLVEFDRLRREQPDGDRGERVQDAYENMSVQREARSLLNAEGWEPPSLGGSLADQLAEEPIPVEWHIPQLAFVGGNVVVVAAAKSGKTVLMLNVLHSLVSGDPLFGHFEARPVPAGRSVAWWNAELTQPQAVDWLRAMDFPRAADFHPLHLRGYAMPFDVPQVEDWAVEWLRERKVMVWAIDPKSALFSGEENSNTENGEWLKAIDRIKRRAGVETVFLVHHASDSPDTDDADEEAPRLLRGRGATRLEGWADVLWSYQGRFDSPRYLSALGRDVDLEPFGGLQMNPSTRMLRWNGSRATPSQDRRHKLMLAALDALRKADGPLKANEVQSRLIGKIAAKRAALEYGVERGYILKAPGPGNSTLYEVGDPLPTKHKLTEPTSE